MRAVMMPVLAFALVGAADEAPVEAPKPNEAQETDAAPLLKEYQDKLEALKKRNLAAEIAQGSVLKGLKPSNCLDRFERAENESEKLALITPGPLLRRGPNNPETPPLAIYAVDRREDNCAVMVMMGDPEEVRPLPKLGAEDHRLMPADGERED